MCGMVTAPPGQEQFTSRPGVGSKRSLPFWSLLVFYKAEDFELLDHEVGLVDCVAIFLVRVLLDASFNDDPIALSADFAIGDALAHLF